MKTWGHSKTTKLNSPQPVQKNVNRLAELAYKYGSDKNPTLGYSYTDFYYQMFADKRNSIKKLLEIDAGKKEAAHLPNYVAGANFYMWQDFFPNAKIYGVVNNKNLSFKENKIQTFLVDRSNPVELTKTLKKIGTNIDIVIDEGSQDPKIIIYSCRTLMPLLKKDVNYIIEDTNSQQAATIIDNLKNYNCHVMRHSKMISRYDRLISVTNKIG